MARAYINVSGWTSGSTGSDSSGVETDRHAIVTKDGKNKGRKVYPKYHISAILGLPIVLDTVIIPIYMHYMKDAKAYDKNNTGPENRLGWLHPQLRRGI